MLQNSATITFRHVLTQKLYSAITILGLSVGLACFVLITLFVHSELTYDSRWEHADRIYRVSRDYLPSSPTGEAHFAGMPGLAAELLKEDFPQIEKVARIYCCGAILERSDGTLFFENGFADADNELFAIFDFEWLSGDPATALTEPHHLVLTESAAHKYFGETNPLGRTLLVGTGDSARYPLEVVGVIADLGDDTHLRFDMLGSMAAWSGSRLRNARLLNDWSRDIFHTYVLLRDGADIADVQRQADTFFERHMDGGSSASTSFTAIPVGAIHLRSSREGEMRPPRNVATVYLFSAIATFILLLACVNFVNLSTARSAQRAKEVGVRKSIGGSHKQLLVQFLAESCLLALVAMVPAVALVKLALPAFNELFAQSLVFDVSDPAVLGALLVLTLVIGLLAGSYPAFYLSSFEPAQALRGGAGRGTHAATLRKVLVVGQFAIAIALLTATAIVYSQMDYMRSVALGFDKEQLVVVSPNTVAGQEWTTLKQQLLAHPEIRGVTGSYLVPFERPPEMAEVSVEGAARRHRAQFLPVDYDFFETYAVDVVAGRTFSEEYGTDRLTPGEAGSPSTASYVINELAARQFGWEPQEAVGKLIELESVQGPWARFIDDVRGPVVGVVADVYFESLHKPIEPMIYLLPGLPMEAVTLRVGGRDLPGALAYIDEQWQRFSPDLPVSRRFLDQDFDALYQAEERQARMFTVFSGLAVLVACLGLMGLASFATERRTREIGIRKTFGARVRDVVLLFTTEIGKLVLLANLAAWPVAYVFTQRWLESFAYRVDVGFTPFLQSALAALLLASLTVGAIAAKAARATPARSLRHE